MMFFGLFGKKNGNAAIVARQYAILTDAARRPVFYEAMEVPDTVMGRFEMVSTVLILYFRRTRASGRSGQEIAQEIVDAFFEDVDHSIRELGVGDVSVPKRMKKLASMFYGRLESYSLALDSLALDAGDLDALEAALQRNFHPKAAADAPAMRGLARYMVHADRVLAGEGEDRVETGTLRLPEPVPTSGDEPHPGAATAGHEGNLP
jgi:cytochrome b pre-mRNA-processing protein 3